METTNHIKLSELNSKINDVVNNAFAIHLYWVIADITNHSFKDGSNYHFFDLVEKDTTSNKLLAKINGKAWGSGSQKIRDFELATGQKFTNNINVLVLVKVTFHSVFGISLEINDIDKNFTLGVLEQQRQATLERLVEENPDVIQRVGDRYITRNSRLKLPMVIKTIAVISSKSSAGNEDFKHTLLNNQYLYNFTIQDYFTIVQNEEYAQQFLDTIIAVFNSKIKYDAVVINRGGGSQTDFLIFDNYKIGRAVARFPIPIITGIGHQKNETIVDLMAHTSTKTPTKAAEFIINHNKIFEDSIIYFQKQIIIKSQQIVSINNQNLNRLNNNIINTSRTFISDFKEKINYTNSIVINKTKTLLYQHKSNISALSTNVVTKPKVIIYNRLNDIEKTVSTIKSFSNSYLKNHRGYLGHFVSVINLMSPQNILKKGFAFIKLNNKITSDSRAIKTGDNIQIILAETMIESTVKSKSEYNGNDFNL
ncbi:MAG: exodeoxyribonuclease VII large subunit [Flavobacterium sp. BFFFF2]|nr:MAG: exodeoxyribonuclease VII large subunit [Flavobacterium sp. BFFFF2]